MKYDYTKPWLTLDPWQKEVLEGKGNICIVSGRQCGKTTITSILAAQTALQNPNQFIMIGSGVIDQAEHLFGKVKDYIFAKYKDKVVGRATIGFMELKNGSKIFCVPVGDTGDSMRGYTATMVIIDEAALVPDRAWDAIEPVISVTRGRVVLLSTPKFKKGFFYKASLDKETYYVKKISARDCPRHTKDFLDRKQAEKSAVVFAQEYLGEFADDYNRKFTKEWIEKVCVIEKENVVISVKSDYVLGVDVGGGIGKGETTFEVFDATNIKNVFQVLNINSNTIGGPDIERQIEKLKGDYNFGSKTIGYDGLGEGSGSFGYMAENSKLKNCIVDLRNSTRPVDNEGKKTKLLKEYMYDYVETMGWKGELKCFSDRIIKQSFESIQIEYKKNGERGYSGSYDHIVEGIIRAIWMAKTKGLNIFARRF